MSSQVQGPSATAAPTKTRPVTLDRRWVVLQAVVAAGMIASFAAVMLVIAGEVVVPLAVGAALFAVPLALLAVRPRPAAVAVGIVSTLWLLASIARIGEVLDALARPAATADFLVTMAMQVFSIAGVIGLVGTLRRAPGRVAGYVLATCALLLLLGTVGSITLALTNAAAPVVSNPGQETLVSVQDNDFVPAELVVQPGTTVTWEWSGEAQHDVVGEGFESPLQSEGSFTHRFETAGRFDYVCTIHAGMNGSVEVGE